jgi:hypothetical protein
MISVASSLIAIGVGLGGCDHPPDSSALARALTHARSVITEGRIQVSPDPVPETDVPLRPGSRSPDGVLLARAARMAGFSFGLDREAVICIPQGACRPHGDYRGIVHVAEFHCPTSDSLIVLLRMLSFTPRAETPYHHVYEEVAEVHLAGVGAPKTWRIVKVVTISKS